ncbi:uncharacterized protein LOC101859668 [Aplysia californica]|uniref:Uncharacterized protein LOC101859668 n=1 Tax=Aplysia californica TaxID=6500 RepID=A0ABM0K4E8_APLCA|nr:uncharacterized protein LOC101859668 [Aplysia californica]
MAHLMARRKNVYRFCPRCWMIAHSCSCINILDGIYPFVAESNSILDLEELESVPDNNDGEEVQPGTDLDLVAPLCEKSHQHDEFIPVNDFFYSYLPEALRHPSFYVWLWNCIPLVVRILGQRRATGRVFLISEELLKEEICSDVTCPYREQLGPRHEMYGGIGIITNKHVVQNDEDAKKTTVEFFYNNDDDRRWTVHKEKGFQLHTTNHKMDYTMFTCYTHKKDLLTMIATFDKIRNYAWTKVPPQIRLVSKNYAIIISHPHGTSKKVSIGTVVDRQNRVKSEEEMENVRILRNIYNICDENNALARFGGYMRQLPDLDLSFTITRYTTATCKGSSGAPVFMGNVVMENGVEINQAHTHRGVDKNVGYNNCFT